ncbi:MAG: hypothetical protein H6559_06590 [Lewinellaceae bacterium]|nr:hypothetical protein [Lewinellaceae bacterium]
MHLQVYPRQASARWISTRTTVTARRTPYLRVLKEGRYGRERSGVLADSGIHTRTRQRPEFFCAAPGGTGTGGTFSNADNASTSAEFEISADGSTFTPVASPTGASGNPLYGTYVLEVVVRNTVSGCESEAFTRWKRSWLPATARLSRQPLQLPRQRDDAEQWYQFSQLFTVEAFPYQAINATMASGLYATGSPAPPASPTPLTVPTAFTETATPGTVAGTVVYELHTIHVDGDGYTLEVSDGTSDGLRFEYLLLSQPGNPRPGEPVR